MKLTENTKVRVRVPKHLYEAIQAELDKKHEMEEMATPHDGHEKMEEDSLNEGSGIFQIIQDIMADPSNAYEIAKAGLQMADHEFQNLLAGLGTIATLAGGAIGAKIKDARNKLAAAKKGGSEKPVEEVAETLDLETLMEAVKDASKKKAEEKKKKEAEAKKKKEAEDKKKKEAEAKKKADAKKK
jgi:hypothetical protein